MKSTKIGSIWPAVMPLASRVEQVRRRPAGSIDAFKVEVTSADGGPDKSTVWVDRESRKVLKVSATLPDLGGATLTMEPSK